jgi:hypothetical protein
VCVKKIRSWFDTLTTNGVAYLEMQVVSRLSLSFVEGQRLLFLNL